MTTACIRQPVWQSVHSATGTEETDRFGTRERVIGSTTKPCISFPKPADSRNDSNSCRNQQKRYNWRKAHSSAEEHSSGRSAKSTPGVEVVGLMRNSIGPALQKRTDPED